MADMKPQGTQQYSIESGYESGDANVKAVVSGLTIILVSTLVVMAAMFGMFNVLNGRVLEQEARVPAALSQPILPPEPRLLPSPYTDEWGEARRLAQKEGRPIERATEDGFPWDKRNLEIEQQYDQANAYANHTHKEKVYSNLGATDINEPRKRIPVEEAMTLMAGTGTAKPGTPAVMSWQPEHPALVAGKTKGTMNLVEGTKRTDRRIFDDRPYWETQDEKFSTESSGGTLLTKKPDSSGGEVPTNIAPPNLSR